MTKSGLFGTAAMLAALLATPAMAQVAMQEPAAYCAQYPWANGCNYRYGHPGFWPGEVAAGVIGGAIGTAEAIVTAPFVGSDSYAYYGGEVPYDDSYAYYHSYRPLHRRNVCGQQFGATYQGPDGRWYPC